MWSLLAVALASVSGYLAYQLRERGIEVERLRGERDYYYRLALNYYHLTAQREAELVGARKREAELKNQILFFKKQLEEAKKERVLVEKTLTNILSSNKKIGSKVDKLLQLTEALAKLSEIQNRLDAISKTLEKLSSKEGKGVVAETRSESVKIKKLKKDIEKAIERLLNVADKIEKSSTEYTKFVSDIRSKTDEIVRNFEEQLAYYGESFVSAVTKVKNVARSNNELYNTISSVRGEAFERFALPIAIIKNNHKVGWVKLDEVYHVGGYAPFDYVIIVPEFIKSSGKRPKKKVKRVIFAEMKTGRSGLTDYEYDFARKIISLKSDFIKYGVIKVWKEQEKKFGSVWRVSVEIVEDEKRLKELLSDYSMKE